MTTVAVVGSREVTDYGLVAGVMDLLHEELEFTSLVSGGARGADLQGKIWAQQKELPYKEHIPDWDKYGKSAGYIRNKLIVADADVVVAFWNGTSRGTKHSIDIAKKTGKNYLVWRVDDESKSETNF